MALRIVEPGRIVVVTGGESWSHDVLLIGIALMRCDLSGLAAEVARKHREGGLLEGAFQDDRRLFCRELVERGYVKLFREWTDVWCDEYGDFDPDVEERTATILLDRDPED